MSLNKEMMKNFNKSTNTVVETELDNFNKTHNPSLDCKYVIRTMMYDLMKGNTFRGEVRLKDIDPCYKTYQYRPQYEKLEEIKKCVNKFVTENNLSIDATCHIYRERYTNKIKESADVVTTYQIKK